jgi:hypothetical protein
MDSIRSSTKRPLPAASSGAKPAQTKRSKTKPGSKAAASAAIKTEPGPVQTQPPGIKAEPGPGPASNYPSNPLAPSKSQGPFGVKSSRNSNLRPTVPNRPVAAAYFEIGAGYLEINAIKEAIVMFTHALAADHTFADAYVAKGLLYLRQDDLRQAVYGFNLALACNDKHAEAYLGRALVYAKKGMYFEAHADACRAVKSNPINATFINARNQLYAKLTIKRPKAE